MAAFDFDGTLIRGDSLLPFLRRARGGRALAAALLAASPRLVAPRDRRDRAKEAVLGRLLRGEPVARLEALADAYAAELVSRRVLAAAWRSMEWHRARGHTVVIVSASPELYVAPAGRRLGADAVLATRLEVDGAGRLAGRLLGPNCRGPEKAARLRAWLGGPCAELWCYGNGPGDADLLALADHPVRVRWRGRGEAGRRRDRLPGPLGAAGP